MNKNDENELESNPNSDSNTSDEIVNNNKLDEQNNLLQSANGNGQKQFHLTSFSFNIFTMF
jgi:hypothetical protein